MRGHCILSHGFESGPDATKVTALSTVAERHGWTHERPDYTDLDARQEVSRVGDVPARLQRLLALTRDAGARGPVLLAGSSLGAWISARVSLEVPVAGLFLLAPPVRMAPAPDMETAPGIPVSIVHGWNDELIDAAQVVAWSRARQARLLLVDDGHRLASSVGDCADAFDALLASLR